GLTLHYDTRGSGDTALVFVHCWACDRAYWREQLDVFADRYRVVSLDLGGHG
ncbi:MAG: alpha/beta hydrolase, partial [Actinobacteria bacterium]|nr:alpha/beta hydrolase [Actinomycetota bacterium]NIU68310.1 alpha/beta hydrolase [Actinomycetota bacterium]NIX22553.1 alpha/beta hydrolase [Actinomycetota bacterium]